MKINKILEIGLIVLPIIAAGIIIYLFKPFYLYSGQLLKLMIYLIIFMFIFGIQDAKRFEVHKYAFLIGLGLGFIGISLVSTQNPILLLAYFPISLILIGMIYLLNKKKKALADYLILWLSFGIQPFISVLAYGIQAGINNTYKTQEKPGIWTYACSWIIVFTIMLILVH